MFESTSAEFVSVMDVMNETLSPEDSSSIQFTVLTKKGNKPSVCIDPVING